MSCRVCLRRGVFRGNGERALEGSGSHYSDFDHRQNGYVSCCVRMKSRTREKKGLERGRAKQKRIVEKATKSDSFQETTRMVARSFHILSLILPKP